MHLQFAFGIEDIINVSLNCSVGCKPGWFSFLMSINLKANEILKQKHVCLLICKF